MFPFCCFFPSCHKPLLSSTVIDAPSQVDVRDVTDTTALITWFQPVAQVDGISVSYGPVTDKDRNTIELSSMDTQYHLAELYPDTEYEVSLMTRRGEMTSFPVYRTFTTGTNSLEIISELKAKIQSALAGLLIIVLYLDLHFEAIFFVLPWRITIRLQEVFSFIHMLACFRPWCPHAPQGSWTDRWEHNSGVGKQHIRCPQLPCQIRPTFWKGAWRTGLPQRPAIYHSG